MPVPSFPNYSQKNEFVNHKYGCKIHKVAEADIKKSIHIRISHKRKTVPEAGSLHRGQCPCPRDVSMVPPSVTC